MAELDELAGWDSRHHWHPFTRMQVFNPADHMMVRAEDCYVWDARGRRYFDAFAGLWSANAGHNRPEIVEAIVRQVQSLAVAPLFGSAHPAASELASRLAAISPGDLNRVFFSVQGSQAVETAFKLARQYWRSRRRNKFKIISRRRAYHGTAFGGVSAQGIAANRAAFEPLVPGFSHIAPPYPYRCSRCAATATCSLACADELAQEIELQGAETVAAFIAEPLMGTGGVIPSPLGYLERIRDICAENEVLFIADEVMTGFGRTGHLFAIEPSGVVPDMLLLSKGLTSGHLPLAATVVTDEIYDAIVGAPSVGAEFSSGCTFDGYPAACAAALANLDVIEREGLVDRAATVGEKFQADLRGLQDHPLVGEVRGTGMVAGVELVADKATRKPFPTALAAAALLASHAYEAGVIVRPLTGGAVVAIAPPLTASENDLSWLVGVLRQCLDRAVEQLKVLSTVGEEDG